jgi:hypothetical protein
VDTSVWSTARIADELQIDERTASPVIDAMIAAGFLEERPSIDPRDDERFYQHGPDAARLCNARFMKRMKRAKADKMVSDLLERARAINARPELVVGIGKICVFGSYLTTESDLGDIDLAVEYARKTSGRENTQWSLRRARESGRQFSNFGEELFFGDREVAVLLRNRNAYLSLHTMDEMNSIKAVNRVIFRAEAETIAGFGGAQMD